MAAAGLTIAVTAAVIAGLLTLERLWPAAVQRSEWANNAAAFVLTMFGNLIAGVAPAILVTALINAAGRGLIDLRDLPLPLGAAVWLVAMDLGEYLFHRAQHAVPWLWAMHSLHHSDRGLGVLTARRHFWLEPALKAVSIWLIVALVFRADAAILAIYAAISLYHFAIHANLRLGFGPFAWMLNSPQYHRLHHSREPRHYNANYASLLPIFDVLSGSYRRPGPGEFPTSGLEETAASPLDIVTWPVRKMARRAITA
ncbi:MAG TPA: sterol desaturase family protein [Caulobacteraceae bacterium]|jgi:sterol desaturase/sphingolipid hydroxylase (fatty acid hydroxylase superfamily)